MNILITGGGGFIGGALIQALVDKPYQITSFSRNSYPELEKIGVKHIQGDIQNREQVLKACEGKDAVFHIAAKVGLWGTYGDFYKVNFKGTKNIIEACQKHQVKYIIFTSSASVVFDGESIENGTESLPYPTKPLSHYTATKAMAEQLILMANTKTLKTISLRPHLVWGPGDQHLIPEILNRAKNNRIWQIGGEKTLIDTTFIDNLIQAQLRALEALKKSENVAGEAYFISNGEPLNTWEFVNKILSIYELPKVERKINEKLAILIAGALEYFYLTFRLSGEPPLTRFTVQELCKSHWFDLSKSKEMLHYHPEISNEAGMQILKQDIY